MGTSLVNAATGSSHSYGVLAAHTTLHLSQLLYHLTVTKIQGFLSPSAQLMTILLLSHTVVLQVAEGRLIQLVLMLP